MKLAGYIAAAVLAAPTLGAQEQRVPLTVAEALARVTERNASYRAAEERSAAGAAQADAVRRMTWPRVAVTSGWTHSNTPSNVFMHKLNSGQFTQEDFAIDRLNDPDALSHLSTALSIQVPIDLLGKVSSRAEGASAQARAASAQAREALLELKLQVVQTYRQAALAAEVVRVTERAAEVARAREDQIAARVDQGAALRADLLRARTRRRGREADLAARRGDERVALVTLSRLLDAEPGILLVPSEAAAAPEPLGGSEALWAERAFSRPALEAAREAAEASRWSVTAESKASLPDLGVFGELRDDRNTYGSKQSGTVGVGLTWNAFDGSRSKRLAAAEASQRAAELEVRALEDRIRLEVAAAWAQAQAARERHAAASGGAEEGREAFRVMQQRREAGMATLTDELETEAASLAAELDEIQAAAMAAIADAALRRAAGEL
jgi:outer membrane protein TolC